MDQMRSPADADRCQPPQQPQLRRNALPQAAPGGRRLDVVQQPQRDRSGCRRALGGGLGSCAGSDGLPRARSSGLAKASARFATTLAMPPTGGGNGPSISTRTAGSEPTFIDDASNYLRLTGLKLGLLLNFGAALMKDGIIGCINALEQWRVHSREKESRAETQRRREEESDEANQKEAAKTSGGRCGGQTHQFSLPFAPLRLCASLFLPRRN